jgi:hypothetical protein
VVAACPQVGEELLAFAATGSGPLRVPLPATQTRLRDSLAGHGFHEAVRTTRMHLGPSPPWYPERIFSAFNLYWG